jgi:hypothetical protein
LVPLGRSKPTNSAEVYVQLYEIGQDVPLLVPDPRSVGRRANENKNTKQANVYKIDLKPSDGTAFTGCDYATATNGNKQVNFALTKVSTGSNTLKFVCSKPANFRINFTECVHAFFAVYEFRCI